MTRNDRHLETSAYDHERPFAVDPNRSARRFHYEPDSPSIDSLRIVGHFDTRNGHLVIASLTSVDWSRYVTENGTRRLRRQDEVPDQGIDSAHWKQVHIGEALRALRGWFAGLERFAASAAGRVNEPAHRAYLERIAREARAAAASRTGRKRLSAEDIAALCTLYLAEVAEQPRGAATRVAEQLFISTETVRWRIKKAQAEGWLQRQGPPGVATARPGPKLEAWLQKRSPKE